MFESVIQALNSRGFIAKEFATAAEAKQAVLEEISAVQSVGVGGSVTINSMGIVEALQEKGCSVYRHMGLPWEEQLAVMEQAAKADVYMLSANALTEDGILLNTDGIGNRLSASIYGKKKVYFIIGRNKITPDLMSGLKRIKEVASPLNAQRLELKTPCGITGKCADCRSRRRICNATVIYEGPTRLTEMHVFLINEDLGY